jgi:hypothetical protein
MGKGVVQAVVHPDAFRSVPRGVGGQLENLIPIVVFGLDNREPPDSHVANSSGGGPDIFGITGPVQNDANIVQVDLFGHQPTISSWLKK